MYILLFPRLPSFTDEEKVSMTGTADFIALNFYSVSLVSHKTYPKDVKWDYLTDSEIATSRDSSWLKGEGDI